MARELISSGSPFEQDIGYSRAIVDGNWIFVAGTTGFNYETMEISNDVAAQCEQTFQNITLALEQAHAALADVVRVHYILSDRNEWPACWPVTRRHFGEVRPAATMFVAQLQDPLMKIEIEVTALKRE